MLNFNSLICVCDLGSKYSFVGVVKDKNQLYLRLPKGYQDHFHEFKTFEQKRDLFFLLYNVQRRFKFICVEKGYLESHKKLVTRDRDGVVQGEAGSAINVEIDEPPIFYAKLDSIGSLLDAYDELKITTLSKHPGLTDRIDLTKLHQYLSKGIFLPNGAVYIDSMVLPRQQFQLEATDIMTLYCYLVQEVKTQLNDEISPEVNALAERFRHGYLNTEDSLFAEYSFDRVVNILKEALDTIDQRTPLKNEDYDQFYDAIEQFLYGNWEGTEDGEIWGIKNFYSVWESICLTYLVQAVPAQSLAFIDRTFVPNSVLQALDASPKLLDLTEAFICNAQRLVPDAVVFPSIEIAAQIETIYTLSRYDWNDYGYYTSFNCKGFFFDNCIFQETIKIAYADQLFKQHTIQELVSASYILNLGHLLIHRPLPKRFYSYWSIDLDSGCKVFGYHWRAMQRFNHIFYLAVQQGIWTQIDFQEWLYSELNVTRYNTHGGNVFESSLLRECNLSTIKENFERFIFCLLQFDLIDVKYSVLEYFRNSENIQVLKERSVRKQFVYEHLLHQHIKALVPKASPAISSYFWIPSSEKNQPFLSDAPVYLDGYLKLVNVNLLDVMEQYITVVVLKPR